MDKPYTPQEVYFLKTHQHFTLKRLSSHLNRTRSAVRCKLRQLGLTYKKESNPITKSERERCVELFEQDLSIAEVSNAVSRSAGAVRKIYAEWILTKRKPIELPEIVVTRNEKLYWETESEIFASIRPEYKEEDLTGEEKGILTLIKKGEIKL